MNTEMALKIELNLASEKIIHHFQQHNTDVQEQITSAFDEVIKEIDVKALVKQAIKKDFESAIWTVVNRYSFREDFKKILEEKVQKKLVEYADQIVTTLGKQLNIDDL